jgi:hypothetical protein
MLRGWSGSWASRFWRWLRQWRLLRTQDFLLVKLSKERIYRLDKSKTVFVWRVLFAVVLMGEILYYFVDDGDWQSLSTFERVRKLFARIACGAGFYTAVLLFPGFRLRYLL